MHQKLIAALMGAVAVMALAACSSAGAPAATATPGSPGGAASSGVAGGSAATQAANAGGGGGGANLSDPCSLVTQQEVSTAIGESVVAGTNAQDSHECNWFYPNNDSVTGASITIQDGDLASYCGKPSDPALGLTIEQLSGIGDGACFTYVGTTTVGANLTFVKNGHVFTTTAYFGGGTPISKVEDADKALAQAALNHM
jgi:hypothetical protein